MKTKNMKIVRQSVDGGVEVLSSFGVVQKMSFEEFTELVKNGGRYYSTGAQAIAIRLFETYGSICSFTFQGNVVKMFKIAQYAFTLTNTKCILYNSNFDSLEEEKAVLTNFIERFKDKKTISTVAYDELKKFGYNGEKTFFAHDDRFRKFYSGGRCEAKVGVHTGPLFYIDINSAYSSAMVELHPCGERAVCSNNEEDIVEQSLVTLYCKSSGAFGIKNESGAIEYKHSLERYNVTGWEYLMAKKLGIINEVRIINVYNFEKKVSFKKFVEKWYAEKVNAKTKHEKAVAKLILNSAYGKLAQDARRFAELMVAEDGEFFDGWEILNEVEGAEGKIYNIWGRAKFNEETIQNAMFNNVVTASSISGYVRAKMMEARFLCKGFVYCDTDSLICEAPVGLEVGTELGQWKLEGIVETAYIGGRKLYCLELAGGKYKTASRGINLSPEEVKDVCSGNEIIKKMKIDSLLCKFNEIEKTVKNS